MNLQATWASEIDEPRGATMKFTYPSGSRPLAGYTIKRGVGQGGFGEVYYATSDGGKEVALKLVRRNLSVEVRGVSQCLNLKHPNLVALYDIRQDDSGDSWVVMEYVGGEALEDVVVRHPQGMPRELVLHWMRGICAAVGYLHDQGIVHRDLKPGNIFDDDGVVKLGDYGLSKFISASRRSGQTESVGTVHYMAPEVANGRYGKEIDIYALGILLYELVTGRVPFEGESVGEVLMKHLTAQPDLSALAEPYQSIVRRALDKDPAHRLSNVHELMAAIDPQSAGFSAQVAENSVPPIPFAQLAGSPPLNQAAAHHAAANPAAATGAANPADGHPAARYTAEAFHAANSGEPIWRWVSSTWKKTWNWIHRPNMPLLPEVLLLIVMATAAVVVASVALPLLIVAAVLYFVYLILWAIFWAPWAGGAPWPSRAGQPPSGPPNVGQPAPGVSPPGPPQPPRAAVVPPVAAAPLLATPVTEPPASAAPTSGLRRTMTYYASRKEAKAAVLAKTPREQMTELLGSLFISALVAVAATLIAMAVTSNTGADRIAWVASVATLGAWGVLIPAKFWEGTTGEPMVRRLVLFCVGIGLGLAGSLLANALLIEPQYSVTAANAARRFEEVTRHVLPISDGGLGSGNPRLTTYLFCFGLLLPVLRWWKQADPLRPDRLNLWNVAICGVVAYVVSQICEFPDVTAMMVAVVMSLAIQLSSPWVGVSRSKAGQ